MPELHLNRSGDMLAITLGEHSATVPFADVALHIDTWERIYKDVAVYGRALFDNAFRDEQLRARLSALPANERLLLVADDPSVAAIPWEYLRDQDGKLLASRFNFVRGLPDNERRDSFTFAPSLEIVAIPVSPIDEKRVLDVEREWKDLVQVVTTGASAEALTVKRVRPPTKSDMAGALNRRATSIVHFMGHSASRDGKAWLVFEDARASSILVDAADFGDALNPQRVFLVVLNSCLSAVVATTEFGNIARSLVRRSFPYALGTQFFLPDDAALVLSKALYTSLLQGASVEEAVTHVRRTLEEPGKLSNPAWLAGIPVFYTSLRTPATALELAAGKPIVQPDPEQLEQTTDLTALPKAEHFVGRSQEIRQALDALLAPHARGFVLLHGLGGIGKTATVRVIAERVGYSYQDRVLAISFETFASLDGTGELTVNEQFADRFYNRLARYYGLDPAQYPAAIDLQQAILQRRAHLRSLLVLDNIETLIDSQRRDHPAAKALASFIARLKEGDGAILLTSRIVPPADWGDCELIYVSGLADEAGADLFLALLPTDREHLAPPAARISLSRRVQGHPLSIRLLAGRFADESATDLATFLQQIEAELESAEQQTPSSLEDPERHRTLYACMDYSVRRLSPDQRHVLDAVSLFLAPFPPEFAVNILNDKEQAPVLLQSLVRLGLLTATARTFQEGELVLLELHPMLRWYIQHRLPAPDATLQVRYGEVYRQLAQQSYQHQGGYDQSGLMRYLVRQSLPDFEAALQYLPPAGRSNLAYHLAEPYMRLGQNRRALALYEQALEIDQELGDVRGVAVTQIAMADVLRQLGRPQEALSLYEQSLRTDQELGDVRGVAVTQHAIADLLRELGRPQEAIALYKQSLQTMQELGDLRLVASIRTQMAFLLLQVGEPQEALALYQQSLQISQELGNVRNVVVTQNVMGDTLVQLGKPQEALALYEQSLRTAEELGDRREVAVAQNRIANILVQLGKPQEALALYEQSLRSKVQIGDVRGAAITQQSMADLLVQLGKPQEALSLYEQSLRTDQELGDVRGVAVTQHAMADVLSQLGKPQEALSLYEQSLRTDQELGDVRGVAVTQSAMADVLRQLGKPQEALSLYEQSLRTKKKLGDVRGVSVTLNAMANVLSQLGKPQEALSLLEQSLRIAQELGEVRGVAVTQHAMADVLRQLGKPQEALALYEQSLRTDQELGAVREVAITQANLSQLLLQQGEHRRALAMAWAAYTNLHQSGFSHDAQGVQQLLISIKGQVLGPAKFDALWQQAIGEAQPDWLRDVQTSASSQQARISSEQLRVIAANSITVMTGMPEKHDEWRETIDRALKQRQDANQVQEAELFTAILAILDNQPPSLLEGHPYAEEINAIQTGIAAGGQSEDSDAWGDALPFDAELIPQSIAALLGSPQEKMAHAQSLMAQAARTSDEELKALLNVIQLALFGNDLSQLGRDLRGVYRQAWETIAVSVEAGGINPEVFEMIARNTLAVLGPAAKQRGEWRSNLVDLRNRVTAHGDRNMAALLEAVIGLLDAGGKPDGLGTDLKGIYAATWQAIVQGLSG